MTLRVSEEKNEIFYKIYEDNDLSIDYVVSFNNIIDNHLNTDFVKFRILTTVSNMPTTFENLIKHNKDLKEAYEIAKSYETFKILVTINYHYKYKKHFKMIYFEEII